MFSTPPGSADLVESAASSELAPPCIPNPSIKFRHTLPLNKTADDNAVGKSTTSQKQGLSAKKTILIVLGSLVLVFLATVGNMLAPLISAQYFPPKWVADFRSGRAITQTDWAKGKELMQAALSDGDRQKAPIPLQMTQHYYYGQTLQNHKDYNEATKVFHEVGDMASRNHIPDKQVLACIAESDCQHLIFINDFSKKPSTKAAEKALGLSENIAPDKAREAYAAVTLAKLEGDLGNKDLSEKYFTQAEKIYAQQPNQLAFIAQVRGQKEIVTIIKNLAGMPVGTVSRATNLQLARPDLEQQEALKFLSGKKFAQLEQLFTQSTANRERQYEGSEKTDYLFAALASISQGPDYKWDQRLALLKDWCAAYPDSVTPHIALANFYNCYAQKARAVGLGKTLSPEQHLEFRTRLYLSATELNTALKVGAVTPAWYSAALTNVASNYEPTDRPLYEKLMASGLNRFPDYMPLYLNKGICLQSTYFGAPGERFKYVTDTSDRMGGADGDKLYSRLISSAKDQNFDLDKEFPNISWTRVHNGQKALAREFGHRGTILY